MKRIAIFVDGANLFYTQRDVLSWWIDWRRVIDYYRRHNILVAARYYRALKGEEANPDEPTFGSFLVSVGYSLCEKPLKEIFDKYSGTWSLKGNLDVELALDAYEMASQFDICILVSGDGDFVPLVERLHRKGKTVNVLSTRGAVAIELRGIAGSCFYDLRRYRNKFERRDLRLSTPVLPASDRGSPPTRRSPKQNYETPPGTIPDQRHLSLNSSYSVGDSMSGVVIAVTELGAVVKDSEGLTAFVPIEDGLPAGQESAENPPVKVGDKAVVRIVELRPGPRRASLMAEFIQADS